MTDIVKLQRANGLSPQFIKATALIRAAGLRGGLAISGRDGWVQPTRAALANGPSQRRVLRRFGGIAGLIDNILNPRFTGVKVR